MRKKKMSIVISPHLLEEMSNYVRKRGRSKFIEQALQNELKRLKKQKLIQAYRESAKEAEQENQFFEGVSGDGLSKAW
jgi:metal-responsive CopG/Arc/MetJ family transcriptional regulator